MKKILIVEDNHNYRMLLTTEFSNAGYDVSEADSPLKGLEMVALTRYDAVVSDLNLPIMSGVLFTESVKNISPQTICIILTGDPDESSELESIENNIDLYIEKNKSMSVILSYVEKLITQNKSGSNANVILVSRNEDIKLYTKEHRVTKNGEDVDLTPKEYEILRIFLSNKNQVVSREEFIDQAWEEPAEDVDMRLVASHIKKLRDKLQSLSIMTVRGYGYRWNEVD